MTLTSNLPSARWGDVFGDLTIASAMIDRMVHHADGISLKGNSYRLKKHQPAASSAIEPQPRGPVSIGTIGPIFRLAVPFVVCIFELPGGTVTLNGTLALTNDGTTRSSTPRTPSSASAGARSPARKHARPATRRQRLRRNGQHLGPAGLGIRRPRLPDRYQ